MKKYTLRTEDGDIGIYQTVAAMRSVILRDKNADIVQNTVKQLKGNSKLETLENIYNFVWKNYKYIPDPEEYELVTSAIHLLEGTKQGEDCDGLVVLLNTLLEAAGFETAIKIIAWRIYGFTHVISEVKMQGYWIPLDPTLKGAGFGRQTTTVIRENRFTAHSFSNSELPNFLNDGRTIKAQIADEKKEKETEATSATETTESATNKKGCRNTNQNKNANCIKAGSNNDLHNGNTININFGAIASPDSSKKDSSQHNSTETDSDTTTDNSQHTSTTTDNSKDTTTDKSQFTANGGSGANSGNIGLPSWKKFPNENIKTGAGANNETKPDNSKTPQWVGKKRKAKFYREFP